MQCKICAVFVRKGRLMNGIKITPPDLMTPKIIPLDVKTCDSCTQKIFGNLGPEYRCMNCDTNLCNDCAEGHAPCGSQCSAV